MSAEMKVLMSHLGSFRPSDRDALTRHLQDAARRDVALDAIKDFVKRWEKAGWLEAYSIERLGKWVAKYHRDDIVQELQKWAGKKTSPARQALADGLKAGASVRLAA